MNEHVPQRLLIVPAAGLGTRLGASVAKALVPVNGRPMLDYLRALYAPYVAETVVIAHPSFAGEIRRWADAAGRTSVIEQQTPTGMLDAILLAAPAVARCAPASVWITWCDQVGVLPETVARLARESDGAPALAMPTVRREHPYIHLERDAEGRVVRVLQRREGDGMPADGESDMGLFSLARETFERDLQAYAEAPAIGASTGERLFLPFAAWLARTRRIVTFPCTDPMEAVGINTSDDLHAVEAWLEARGRR